MAVFTVTFRRVYVFRSLPRRFLGLMSAGELLFRGTIDRQAATDEAWRTSPERIIELPRTDSWRRVVDIRDSRRMEVEFTVVEPRSVASDVQHGRLRAGQPWPYTAGTFFSTFGPFILEWSLQEGRPGEAGAAPGDVRACRGSAGSTACTTVGGAAFLSRFELHPVIPCPPPPNQPNRPAALTGGVYENGAFINAGPTDPINCFPNPAVIPILTTRDAAELRRTAAVIQCTYYRPDSLRFTENDFRLEWNHEVISGSPQIEFTAPPAGRAGRGMKVWVHGKPGGRERSGEVRLRVRFQGANYAEFRALVRPIIRVPFRLNILNGGSRANPRATPELAADHVKVANRFFRQLGVELVPDTNTDPGFMPAALASSCTITSTTEAGIYRIAVPRGITRFRGSGNYPDATALNYRANVLNINYIHSDADGDLGWASDFRSAGGSVSDNGRPSSSWKPPSGIAPDGAPVNLTMTLFAAGGNQRPGHPDLFACLIMNDNGSPVTEKLTYGGSIAHELGHVFGIRHRIGAGDDGIRFPPMQNVMHGTAPSAIAQDWDILQAKAVVRSPIVSRYV